MAGRLMNNELEGNDHFLIEVSSRNLPEGEVKRKIVPKHYAMKAYGTVDI
jgi:hypothetical protein